MRGVDASQSKLGSFEPASWIWLSSVLLSCLAFSSLLQSVRRWRVSVLRRTPLETSRKGKYMHVHVTIAHDKHMTGSGMDMT